MTTARGQSRLFPSHLQAKVTAKTKIVAITAYDHFTATIAEAANADVILVGDSLGTVISGRRDTLSVSLQQMVYHCEIVSRISQRALVVGDMPFMSYQVSPEDALRTAGSLVQEGGVASVKLEGGMKYAKTIERIVRADIPVMGHVGLTPQSVNRMGGYKVQGKNGATGDSSREAIIEDALAVEGAGAFSVVLEGVPEQLGKEISEMLSIPTIGIGAGRYCDGQILVIHDLLGFNENAPKFVKKYLDGFSLCKKAATAFADEVRAEQFPTEENVY